MGAFPARARALGTLAARLGIVIPVAARFRAAISIAFGTLAAHALAGLKTFAIAGPAGIALFLFRTGRRGIANQLEEFLLLAQHRLVDFDAGGALDIPQIAEFGRVAQRHGDAGLAGARGPANAVDIAFRNVRQVEIDHVGDVVDINAASGNVCGDEDVHLAGLEAFQRLDALALGLVAMDGGRLETELVEMLVDPVRAALGAGKHDGAVNALLRQDFQQQLALGGLRGEDHRLLDPLDRTGDRRDGNLGRIGQEIMGQRLDLLGHGGRQHGGLTRRRQHADDLADGREEAEVQHLVGLVQHQGLNVFQGQGARLHQVEQTARRGDDDIDAATDDLDLRADFQTTDHQGRGQAHVAGIGLQVFTDLGRQLTRRRQDQGAAGFRLRTLVEFGQAVQDRQHEGGGLAGTGLGNAHQVTAGEKMRDGLRLDRGRLVIACVLEGTQDRVGQAELGKLGQGIKNFRSSARGHPAAAKGQSKEACVDQLPGSGTPRRPGWQDQYALGTAESHANTQPAP